MLDLDSINKIYFVGIGGIAMSAVAGLAKDKGLEVLGSDSKEVYPPSRDVLNNYRIQYFIGYDAAHVEASHADLYVLSAGEGPENPEVQYILDKDLPRASFPELLEAMYADTLRIVVAGTHGKSTTSGMLGHLFQSIDNSSYMVGGVLQNTNANFHAGDGHYVVFEGDEYKSQFDDPTPKFQYYKPDILVLTNLEYDHPDLFESFEAMQDEFRELIANMPEDGLIIYNADDVELARLVHESNVASTSFAIHNKADYKIEQLKFDADYTTLEILNEYSEQISTKLLGQTEQYKTQLPGEMNAYNALACIATLRRLGFSQDQIALELLSFRGMKRRFEVVGKKRGITLVDDYAHHPTAVRETLAAARVKYPDSRIWAVFEPHTFSRTQAVLPELAASFEHADRVLISEIYPAREKANAATITSEQVVEAITAASKNPQTEITLVHSKQEAHDLLKEQLQEGDVVIVMAVGSFNRLAYELKEIL